MAFGDRHLPSPTDRVIEPDDGSRARGPRGAPAGAPSAIGLKASLSIRPRSRFTAPIGGVFDFEPRRASARPIAARGPPREDSLKSHSAGVPKHRLAVRAVHVLRDNEGRPGFGEALLQESVPFHELEAAQVVAADVQEVEGVEAGARLAVVAHEPIEVGQALRTVGDRLAIDDNAMVWKGAHRG